MADFYRGLASTADKLLASKGQPLTVRRSIEAFDPVTSETTLTSVDEQTLNAAVFKGGSGFDQSLTEDKIIGKTQSAIISTIDSTFVPEPLDEVEFGGNLWKVYGVSNLSPAGTDVIYKIGLMLLGIAPLPDTSPSIWDSSELWVSGEIWVS